MDERCLQPSHRIIMSRIVTIAGLVTASIIVGGLVLGWLLLPGLGGAEIRQAVARETGRTISFAGTPRLSVWPELAIELRNVELSNPPEMLDGRFAAADTVRLELSGSSLWRGTPEIAQVVVTRPRINLLVDVEGRSNFAFERDGDRALPPVVIVDGSASYLNERAGTAVAVADVDMTLPLRARRAGGTRRGLQLERPAAAAVVLCQILGAPRRQGSPADFTIAGPYLSAAFSGQAAIGRGWSWPARSSSPPNRWPTCCRGPAMRARSRAGFRRCPPAARSICRAAPSA
jgi:AsmA protein